MPKKNAANDAPDTATTEPGGSPLESSLPKRPKIQFIYLDSADGANSAASRKIARSYAARESHARVRRERLLKYQKSKGSGPEVSHATAESTSRTREEQTTVAVTLQRGRGRLMKPASPLTLLSAAPTDPFASTARPVAMLEHYLLDHCKSAATWVTQGHRTSSRIHSRGRYKRCRWCRSLLHILVSEPRRVPSGDEDGMDPPRPYRPWHARRNSYFRLP